VVEAALNELASRAHGGMLPKSEPELLELRQRVSDLRAERASLSLGPAPKNLGAAESKFAEFKRSATNAAELLARTADSISLALDKVRPKTPMQTGVAEINRNAAYLQSRLRRWSSTANEILSGEGDRLSELVADRGKRYATQMLPYLSQLEDNSQTLTWLLNKLEEERDREDAENAAIFDSYISVLRSLQESVDLDVLVMSSLDDAEEARTEISRLNALAQLGITVEIIGHEMDGLESVITRGLDGLPPEVKATSAMQGVMAAHQTLMDKLRFLSPLKLSGDRSKAWISGAEIVEYIRGFLGDVLAERGIALQIEDRFNRLRIYETPSRIYPVFINLVNNSAYWLMQVEPPESRLIVLDVVNKHVVVADNGPGVEAADIRSLFTLFFTRKVRSGRGVGLYLCRANLAAGGHNIWYGESPKERRLDGANFIIDFRGAEYE
jgi:signal transduction histidine kinase